MSSEDSLLGLQMAAFLLCSHMAFPLFTCIPVISSFSHKGTSPIDPRWPHLIWNLKISHSLLRLPPAFIQFSVSGTHFARILHLFENSNQTSSRAYNSASLSTKLLQGRRALSGPEALTPRAPLQKGRSGLGHFCHHQNTSVDAMRQSLLQFKYIWTLFE